MDFQGKPRRNDTQPSSTDPEARLWRKGPGHEAKLCFMGHVLMENKHGLIRDTRLTLATGTAEREAAWDMVKSLPGQHWISIGGDKNYDTGTLSPSCEVAGPCPMWPGKEAARPWMVAPADMLLTPKASGCANGWKKSSVG